MSCLRRWRIVLGLLLLPAAPADGQRIAVISDLNGSYGSTQYEAGVPAAVARLIELKPDLVVVTGDMIAGQRLDPPLPAATVAAMWRAFQASVTDPLRAAGIPVAVTPGNHDASAYPHFQAERAAYRAEWAGRNPGLQFVDRGDYPFHYAFAVGQILFVSLDVTTVGPVDSAQRAWLERLLTREGQRYQHRIVFSHLPIHPFTVGRETEISSDQALERMLVRHGVEVYLSGHHHAFFPGYYGGIRYVSQACLGAAPRRLLGSAVPGPRAVTLIQPDPGGALEVRAVTGERFDQPVDFRQLPARVGVLIRDDLRPQSR